MSELALRLLGKSDPDPEFSTSISNEIRGVVSSDIKLTFKTHELMPTCRSCENESSHSSDVQFVPVGRHISCHFARPLELNEVEKTAKVILTFRTRHHSQPDNSKISILLQREENGKLHIEIRPATGGWQTLKKNMSASEIEHTNAVFHVDMKRSSRRVGFDLLGTWFGSEDRWTPMSHVVCTTELEWSVMPLFIAKAAVWILSLYVRPQILGAITKSPTCGRDGNIPSSTILQDLIVERATYKTLPDNNNCQAKLRLNVHKANGPCWCGLHEQKMADIPTTPQDDIETNVHLEIECCGRPLQQRAGKYYCSKHRETPYVHHPATEPYGVCTSEMMVRIKCVHEITDRKGSPPFNSNQKWTSTSIPIHPQDHERILLEIVMHRAMRVHNLLVKLRTVIDEAIHAEQDLVVETKRHLHQESLQLDREMNAKVKPFDVTNLERDDQEVCKLLRSGQLWTEVHKPALWKAAGIKKTKLKTPNMLQKLSKSNELLARAAAKDGKLRKYEKTVTGGGSMTAKFPKLYSRLAPPKLVSSK